MNTYYYMIALFLGVALLIGGFLMKKAGTRKTLAWVGVVSIVLAGIVWYSAPDAGLSLSSGGISTLAIAGGASGSGTVTTSGGSSVNIITTNPTVTTIGQDAYSEGTSVALTTTQMSTNGGAYSSYTSGTSTAVPGQKIDFLIQNVTPYHTAIASVDVASGTFPITVKMNKNASLTLTLFNTDGDKIANGLGVNNQTMTSGGSANIQIRIDGQDKTSTQDMTCILESTNGTATDKLTLNGFGATLIGSAKPSSYAIAGADSKVWVYDVAPIAGAVSPTGTIGVVSMSGKTLGAGSLNYGKITCMTKEYFLDSTSGKIVYGTEDSAGNKKSIATYTSTFYFQ